MRPFKEERLAGVKYLDRGRRPAFEMDREGRAAVPSTSSSGRHRAGSGSLRCSMRGQDAGGQRSRTITVPGVSDPVTNIVGRGVSGLAST